MEILRYTAFTETPDGGNPAGVVLDAAGLDEDAMQQVAADVGYSETAFLTHTDRDRAYGVRYFSPRAEVAFCGHATVAAAVAHAERHGHGLLRLASAVGEIVVTTAPDAAGGYTATLTSVPTRTREMPEETQTELLRSLGWSTGDLDERHVPLVGFAGGWHPILFTATRERLADLSYDYPALESLMAREDWTTVDLLWREDDETFHSRNPFPPGGVVEDPATGAAAAALGGYLRDTGALPGSRGFTVHQGVDMGRPSTLYVDVPVSPDQGIRVSGAARQLPPTG